MSLPRYVPMTLGLLVLALCAYAVVPCVYLRFLLDENMIKRTAKPPTGESRLYEIPCPEGRSVVVRRYGPAESTRNVVFFPGSGGGIPWYERTIFGEMTRLGCTIYALSYPGQDGAPGGSRLGTIQDDVATALDTLDAVTGGKVRRAAFAGSSFGATLAVTAAVKFRPEGLLLDGVSPSLSHMIRAHFRKHWYTYPWSFLPVEKLLSRDFALAGPLETLQDMPVFIFQGVRDDTTPPEDIGRLAESMPWIRFEVVPGATHADAAVLAGKAYLSALQRIMQ